jgi:hypothetical protein
MATFPGWLSGSTKNRIAYLVQQIEQTYGRGMRRDDQGSLADRIAATAMRRLGARTPDPRFGVANWILMTADANTRDIDLFLLGVFVVLSQQPRLGVDASTYRNELNLILDQEKVDIRLGDAGWIEPGETEADNLLKEVLLDRSEVAGCSRGDVQVEMVASSAQVVLGEGTTIVDYGAGLGRVGDGLSTAREFAFARYIAVDSPIQEGLTKLVASFGPGCLVSEREAHLQAPVPADVVLLVNTLHHIPFADLARQLGTLLRSLRPSGILLVHEMGALDPPEQRNVPWTAARITRLLECDGLRLIARETRSRGKKVPLAHIIVKVDGALDGLADQLTDRAREVWRAMKAETCDTIRRLYESGKPERLVELRRAMIHNANLDLNPPL